VSAGTLETGDAGQTDRRQRHAIGIDAEVVFEQDLGERLFLGVVAEEGFAPFQFGRPPAL